MKLQQWVKQYQLGLLFQQGHTGATGADGKNAEAEVKDNGDGTHTVMHPTLLTW